MSTVLVTGATGFIAQHTIVQLLDAGFRVRGTVQSPKRAQYLREGLGRHTDKADQLELEQADLMSDDGWDEALAGCEYVIHMASPLPNKPPKDENELIVPARDGALRVLKAAARAGVKRVVMTSSVAAVIYGHSRDGSRQYDEKDWSVLGDDVGAYEKSKTIAEKAAWDFVKSLPESERFEFCTINPGLVLGPVFDRDFSTSGEVVRKLMRREMPGCPDVGWAVVDVRDVAKAHVTALTEDCAVGQRFVVAIEHASMLDIANILSEAFRGRGYKVPTRRLPDWLLRVVGVFDKTAKLAVQELGKRQDLSNARARDVLGFQPRSLREMVVDMGETMIAEGAL